MLRPGGIDKLPADFKPRFNFVLSESASGIRRAAQGKEAWLRPKPFETVNVLSTNRCDVRGTGSLSPPPPARRACSHYEGSSPWEYFHGRFASKSLRFRGRRAVVDVCETRIEYCTSHSEARIRPQIGPVIRPPPSSIFPVHYRGCQQLGLLDSRRWERGRGRPEISKADVLAAGKLAE